MNQTVNAANEYVRIFRVQERQLLLVVLFVEKRMMIVVIHVHGIVTRTHARRTKNHAVKNVCL